MKEVARAAEVSVATVSHVINRTRFVSPELAERVRDAMDELGYTPDATARSLRVRRTQTIGLVVPDNSNPFFAELGQAIEEAGFDAGYTTILGNSAEQPERERRYLQALVAKRVDGLIVAPSRDGGTLEAILGPAKIPVVVIDRDAHLPGADAVLYDNEGGSVAATRHLLALGHTNIAFVAGPPDVQPAAERLRGFRRALVEAGLDPCRVVEADFHYAGGRDAAARLLATDAAPTAIFAANDLMAAGVLQELAARGIEVPDDISVVGFDDAPLAEMVSPTVTTVRQPLQQMAKTALALLLARIGGDGGRPSRHVLPTELIVRESSGPVTRRSE
jgi:LacI family transcriptional regulator